MVRRAAQVLELGWRYGISGWEGQCNYFTEPVPFPPELVQPWIENLAEVPAGGGMRSARLQEPLRSNFELPTKHLTTLQSTQQKRNCMPYELSKTPFNQCSGELRSSSL